MEIHVFRAQPDKFGTPLKANAAVQAPIRSGTVKPVKIMDVQQIRFIILSLFNVNVAQIVTGTGSLVFPVHSLEVGTALIVTVQTIKFGMVPTVTPYQCLATAQLTKFGTLSLVNVSVLQIVTLMGFNVSFVREEWSLIPSIISANALKIKFGMAPAVLLPATLLLSIVTDSVFAPLVPQKSTEHVSQHHLVQMVRSGTQEAAIP